MSEAELQLADLRLEHFSPLVGDTFTVTHPDVTEALRLESAVVGKADTDPRRQRLPFTLFIHGTTPNLVLNQQTHPLTHGTLGTLDLFMVPVGQNADGTIRYQVGFN